MFASAIWGPGEDHCYHPPGFLESFVFVVVFIFFLIVFFGVFLTIFSCVSIIEGVAISDGVLPIRVQCATYVFDVVISSGFGKLLWFVSHCHGVVWSTFSFLMSAISMILVVCVVSIASIREPLSCLLFCRNHLFYCSSEFFVVSQIFFAEVLKLPPSHDSVRESFNYFSFGDVMHLSPQFAESSIVISETFAPLLLESF